MHDPVLYSATHGISFIRDLYTTYWLKVDIH